MDDNNEYVVNDIKRHFYVHIKRKYCVYQEEDIVDKKVNEI